MNELSITIAGNVVSDVKVFTSPGAATKARFRVAFNQRRRDPRTAGWVDGPAQFFQVTCWNRLAENVAVCLRKGMPVIVRGKLQVTEKEYEGSDGPIRRTYVDVDAHHVGIDLLRGVAKYESTKSPAVVAAEERAIADAMAVAGLSE